MIRIFRIVSISVLLLCSCSNGSVDNSEKLVVTTTQGSYKMQIDVEIELLFDEISRQYDMVSLSYAHGISTYDQLKRERLEFIDVNVFISHLKRYFENPSTVPEKSKMSIKLQDIAQKNQGDLQHVTGVDKEIIEESVAALVFDLFVDHLAFNSLDLAQYQKGIIDAWEGKEIEGMHELQQSYYQYKESFTKELGVRFLAENKLRDEVKETASGLQYEVIIESADTEDKPDAHSEVTVHYHGELLNGRVFDSSYNRGETLSFGLNQVIPGWTEALQLMSLGAKYRFYIPYELAYGERGNASIPGFSMLIFDVELFEFN